MSEFTKGPWTVEDFRQVKEEAPHWSQPTYANGGFLVFSDECEHHPVADCSANHTCRDESECEANAHLIAAAPEMLEALIVAKSQLISFGGYDDSPYGDTIQRAVVDAISLAIAKAEGK